MVDGSFFIRKTQVSKIPLQRVSPDSCSSSPPFFRRYFAFWHSCLSDRKHPTLTSYSRNPQLPPSDVAPFCRMNRYLERFSLLHTQPFAAYDKSHAVSGHMESPSSVYLLFHFCRITHNACRLRLPRIWNPSFMPFGLNKSGAVFCGMVRERLQGLPNVESYIDDLTYLIGKGMW